MRRMTKRFSGTVFAALCTVVFLLPSAAEAEVRLEKPSKNVIEVVSDGPSPWKLPFWFLYGGNGPAPALVSAGPDRSLFAMGNVLHLIDTKNGVVIGRWILPMRIDNVQADGKKFLVRTSSEDKGVTPETTTIEAGSAQPPYWMDQALLPQRLAVYEGGSFDEAAHFREKMRKPPEVGMEKRQPLAPREAERLLSEVKEAARRNPFQPRFVVVQALLMKDAGSKEADSVFRQALDSPTNFFAELFPIAADLENVGEEEWSTLAFERAYALLWKQGHDPRMIYSVLPRLILLYLPYELRLEIPAERRALLSDRLYRLGPNVEWSPAAWMKNAAYFNDRGDKEKADLWRGRADESAKDSAYVWEPVFYLERTIRGMAALVLAVLVYYRVLQRRYAPQRRLLRKAAASPWKKLRVQLSLACWDRRDRVTLVSLLLLFWLSTGLTGGLAQSVVRTQSAPYFGGTMRSPRIQTFLESLPPSAERSFLMALSLQQADQPGAAETLYRTLTDSSQAWNNLGVLQSGQGKDREAAQSFENAIRLEPGMQEATFNLGRPVTGYWVDQYRIYRPEQKMLALPSHAIMYRAIRGPLPRLTGNMLMGPFSGIPGAKASLQVFIEQANMYKIDLSLPVRLMVAYGEPVVYILLAFLSVLGWSCIRAPYQEVTQTPRPGHWLLELLIPGTARVWQGWGGFALGAAFGCILEIVFRGVSLTGFKPFVGDIAFGLPPIRSEFPRPTGFAGWPTDPGWLWTSGPTALLFVIFVVNAVLVLRSRWIQNRGRQSR